MPTPTADISVRSSGADVDCARCAARLSSGLAGHRGSVDASVVDAATLGCRLVLPSLGPPSESQVSA